MVNLDKEGETSVLPVTVTMLVRVPKGASSYTADAQALDYVHGLLGARGIADWSYTHNGCPNTDNTMVLPADYQEGDAFPVGVEPP